MLLSRRSLLSLILASCASDNLIAFAFEGTRGTGSELCTEAAPRVLTSLPLHWTSPHIPYYVNLDGAGSAATPANILAAIQAGFNEWARATNNKVIFVFVGTTSNADGPSDDCTDGRNVVFWDKDGSKTNGALGVTTIRFNPQNGQIMEADIAFNGKGVDSDSAIVWQVGSQGWTGLFSSVHTFVADIQATLTHEAGHMLGLHHSDVVGATMSTVEVSPSFGSSIEQGTIEADDKDGIRTLYPDIFGHVAVTGVLDGQRLLNFAAAGRILGPLGSVFSPSEVNLFSLLPPGVYTFVYTSGCPLGSTMVHISPSDTLQLPPSGFIVFTVECTTNPPPTAGFTMSAAGVQSVTVPPNGGALNVTVPSGGSAATVNFSGTGQAFNGGTVTGWQWAITGQAPANTQAFSRSFTAGTYDISLVVTDSRGAQSTAATGKVAVSPAITPGTSIYVTSANANSIFRFDALTGAFVQQFENSSVQYPYGTALGPDGYLYTATSDASNGFNSHIDRFDPITGKRLASFGALPQTRAMTIGPDGLIYVSAFNADQVWRYNPITSAFVDVFANIARPHGLAFGPDGSLYVASLTSGTIFRVDRTTRAISTFVADPGFSQPCIVFGPDGKLYVGNTFGAFVNQIRRYNGATGTFDKVFASDPALNSPTSLAFGPDGKLYVGISVGSVLRFDGNSGAFVDVFIPSGSGGLASNITGILFALPSGSPLPTGSMSIPRFSHQATLLDNGLVLVTGGVTTGNVPVASAELYDPLTGVWRTTRRPELGGGPLTMSTVRSSHGAVKLKDGRVLIVGGGGVSGSLAQCEIFDPATETFTPTGSLNLPREGRNSVLLSDGRVMVIAGRSSAAPCCTVASTEIYNPATGTWSPAAPVPTSGLGTISPGYTNQAIAVLPDGKVLMTGGYDGYSFNTASAVLRYDPGADAWQVMSPMLTARNQHTATLLSDGRVLIVAGRVASSIGSFFSTELYNPLTLPSGLSSSGNPLADSRADHTATLLPSGKVLIAGGFNYDANATAVSTSSLELFDPFSSTWSQVGAMSSPRTDHTATLLPNGRVLIVGGFTIHTTLANVLASADLF